MQRAIYSFPGNENPTVAEVGGKGHALIQLSRFMPVPPGLVLTTLFFGPWWQQLKETDEWKKFLEADATDLAHCSGQLKAQAMLCTFNDEQNDWLAEALEKFSAKIFAVRSSSPEEDMEGSSFAGAYETVLGVTRKNIQAAVRSCFASCLDYRIVAYKREHGFDIRKPKIAVVIQKQIASEVSGVAFSLNPLTNDFDEAIVNANFGLGETVVAGDVTPDAFVVDKVKLKIKERHLGLKQRNIWLSTDSGTEHRAATEAESARFCLNDWQVMDVVRLVNSVESRNGMPMDIEWAYERGKLYLLQARPVTAFQPLPPDLVTMAGRERRLYWDVTRSVQGFEHPMSEMGLSVIKRMLSIVSAYAFGRDITDHIGRTLPYATAGRLYLNLSNAFAITTKEKIIDRLNLVDPLAAKAIETIDERMYTPSENALASLPLLLARRLPQTGGWFLRARTHPEDAAAEIARDLDIYRQQLAFLKRSKLKLRDFADRVLGLAGELVYSRLIVLLIAGLHARDRIKKLAGKEFAAEVEAMTKALPGNVTVEMGLELFELSKLLPEDVAPEEIVERLSRRSLPPEFMLAWDSFIGKYGHRAPEELDIVTPRYRENPSFLIKQLYSLASMTEQKENMRTKYDAGVSGREAAYQRLRAELSKRRLIDVIRLDSSYRVLTSFLGLRETPKFCLILAFDAIRQRILDAGNVLVSQRQLRSLDEVFELSFDQLCAATEGSAVDLHALVIANRGRRTRLRLATLPKIFDSRGRFIRTPVVASSENEMVGSPISPGRARGTARVLHQPDEKSLAKGDILVARATDPGWTPLFASASAVVLEVGGLLQHGALVAREYGLPCVAGIPNVTSLIQDGAQIEVDGDNGIVRIL